jgi:deoxycytidylate deaminase
MTALINSAISTAKKSTHKHRFGAVIGSGARIISKANNSYKTHPKSTSPYKTTHAELAALSKSNFNGTVICVVRLDSKGNLALARPCKYCATLLLQSKIKKVLYSTAQGIKVESLKDLTSSHLKTYENTSV